MTDVNAIIGNSTSVRLVPSDVLRNRDKLPSLGIPPFMRTQLTGKTHPTGKYFEHSCPKGLMGPNHSCIFDKAIEVKRKIDELTSTEI